MARWGGKYFQGSSVDEAAGNEEGDPCAQDDCSNDALYGEEACDITCKDER